MRQEVCLLRGTDWILTFGNLRSAHTAVFMCFVRIWVQTAIISMWNKKPTGCHLVLYLFLLL